MDGRLSSLTFLNVAVTVPENSGRYEHACLRKKFDGELEIEKYGVAAFDRIVLSKRNDVAPITWVVPVVDVIDRNGLWPKVH